MLIKAGFGSLFHLSEKICTLMQSVLIAGDYVLDILIKRHITICCADYPEMISGINKQELTNNLGIRHKITFTDVDYAFRQTIHITPQFLKKHGIKGLILDVDNTLAKHDDRTPAEGIPEWLENMRKSGIKLIIVSNNHPERVRPFAEPLGLDFVSDSGKPLKKGYTEAMKRMNLTAGETAAVGDQLFTDVWGAKFSGIKMLYVRPMEMEGRKERFIRFKRVMEKPFLPHKFIEDKRRKT